MATGLASHFEREMRRVVESARMQLTSIGYNGTTISRVLTNMISIDSRHQTQCKVF